LYEIIEDFDELWSATKVMRTRGRDSFVAITPLYLVAQAVNPDCFCNAGWEYMVAIGSVIIIGSLPIFWLVKLFICPNSTCFSCFSSTEAAENLTSEVEDSQEHVSSNAADFKEQVENRKTLSKVNPPLKSEPEMKDDISRRRDAYASRRGRASQMNFGDINRKIRSRSDERKPRRKKCSKYDKATRNFHALIDNEQIQDREKPKAQIRTEEKADLPSVNILLIVDEADPKKRIDKSRVDEADPKKRIDKSRKRRSKGRSQSQ